MNEEAQAVIVLAENSIGIIIEQGYGYAKVRFTDLGGIEHEEYLSDEDYIFLEEWTQE